MFLEFVFMTYGIHAQLHASSPNSSKIVQDRLGHSSIQMTLDKYSHITQNMQQQAAENFENVIKPYENIKINKNQKIRM